MVNRIKTTLRVDHDRLNFALDTADFIVDRHDDDGAYRVSEHWGPEGEIYRAICVWALLDAYNVSNDRKYLDKSKTILERFKKRQCESGGWTISLGSDGIKFKITDDERDDSNTSEDPVIAGAVLKRGFI